MSALERSIPLTEIGASARAAANSGAFGRCPYDPGSAAAWNWTHVYAATLAQLAINRASAIAGGQHA
jgi:hypothetical protein